MVNATVLTYLRGSVLSMKSKNMLLLPWLLKHSLILKSVLAPNVSSQYSCAQSKGVVDIRFAQQTECQVLNLRIFIYFEEFPDP